MKGIYIPKPGSIELKELPEPTPQPGYALLEIKAAGICGSDISAYKGTNPSIEYPLVMGHELAGVVLEAETNEHGINAGDRVVIEPYFSCGHCYPCRKGRFNNCTSMNVLGVRMDGGMAQRITHPIRYLHKIPADMSWEKAAMVEPLSIAVHATRRAGLCGSEFVAISGAGTIGLLCALLCKTYGAKPILMDVLPDRLAFARKMGITYTIDVSKEDSVALVAQWTDGEMVPVVLECSGAQSAINNALELAANSGRICLVGWAKGPISFNQPRVIRKELNFFGCRNSLDAFPECIDLIHRGVVDVMSLVNLRHSLDELIQGFKELAEQPEKYLKILAVL